MIILINGSINSGKTTVSNLLAKKLENTAHVEVDSLRDFIEWMPLEESTTLNFENAISVTNNFIKHSLNVVISYPISKNKYEMLLKEFKDLNVPIFAFTLRPNIETALKNRGNRELTPWEIERIKYHYDGEIANPTFGEIIDNSNMSPDDTVNIILSKLKK